MTEPASSTTAITIAAGTVTISGSIVGVEYDVLLTGFFGGLVALTYLQQMTAFRVVGSLASAALFAGFFAPVISVALLNYYPWLMVISGATRIAAAFALGLFAQPAIPIALNFLRTKFGGKQ